VAQTYENEKVQTPDCLEDVDAFSYILATLQCNSCYQAITLFWPNFWFHSVMK